MKNNISKNLVHLVIAGLVLLAVNAWAWMGVQNGQLSPVDSPLLWGAFMVLNMASILWAVSLLGLQPLVVACAYAAGGFLAYQGVQGMTSISTAEVTTAGATYGAIGALAVGNATTKVRMAFFSKGQVPFIFVIVGLLVVDGILNSQVSGADWNVILNALIFPFVISGVIIGLIWMVATRFGVGQKPHIGETHVAKASLVARSEEKTKSAEDSQLVIQVPETNTVEESAPEEVAAAMVETPEPAIEEPRVAAEAVAPVVEEDVHEDHFFPLEIDKDDEFILPAEESISVDLSASVEDVPVVDMEAHVAEPVEVAPPIEEPVEVAIEEPKEPAPEAEEEAGAGDWLSNHLNLLNKLNNED